MVNILKFDGLSLGLNTLILTSIFELFNINEVIKIIKYKGCILYLKAWINSSINLLLYGPITYEFVNNYIIINNSHSYSKVILNINFMILCHSFLYTFVHILMHNTRLWIIHKYHHEYSIYVSPIVANAVSFPEYLFAYMFPFIMGSILIVPNNLELLISAGIVSLCNLIIHNPFLERFSKYYPNILISPEKHLTHHYCKRLHYAASTFDLDFLFEILKINK